ncbi:hypothetical protein TREPR_2115 [Treponema primitia ZAS-2]|uniref:Uncharacterized protein n=2 Tax=Treponema primitia TaxID=88058 RepID=F5YJ78_TREPZ|nr:hypothetical protein TREPR_2115 [Treponema primitia ZAS-2]
MNGKRKAIGVRYLFCGIGFALVGKFLRNLLGVSAVPKLQLWALGFVLALAGCAAPVGGPEGGRLGTVRVEVSGFEVSGPQRTAYPTPPLPSGLTYTYTWMAIEGSPTPVKADRDSSGNFILAAGSYTLDVKAYVGYEDDANLVGTGVGNVSGSTTITVTNDTTVTVTVTLKPVDGRIETSDGTLKYTIKYPAGTTVLSLTLQNFEGGDEVNLTPSAIPSSTLTGTKTGLAAGEYLLRAELKNSANGTAGMSETVHIYGNMTTTVPPTSPAPSAASFVFTAGDFI